MTTFGIPFLFEDRTGNIINTEFDDLYDRMFLGVSNSTDAGARSRGAATVKIFELGSKSSPRATFSPNFGRDPTIVLDFGPGGTPGSILFARQSVSMPMGSWIRKTDAVKIFERKFCCSDGEEYKWSHQANVEAEWICTTKSGYTVAQYSFCPPDEEKYTSSSGNVFTVYETHGHIAVELLASLTVVRFMQRYNPNA